MLPNSIWLCGKEKKEFRTEVFERLDAGDIDCVISTLLDEGVNIPNLDAVIITAGGKSPVKVFQRMRSLTKTATKDHGIVVDFVITRSGYIERHGKQRVAHYKSMPGAELIERTIGLVPL